jgi:hypothetical protein
VLAAEEEADAEDRLAALPAGDAGPRAVSVTGRRAQVRVTALSADFSADFRRDDLGLGVAGYVARSRRRCRRAVVLRLGGGSLAAVGSG